MVDKILKSTTGKPCSCPRDRICWGCKSKKVIPNSSNNVQYFETPNRWKVPKRQNYEADPKTSPLCKWYRRRKALKELIAEHKKEQELLNKERREEYERERMKNYMEWEREQDKERYLSTDSGFKWRRDRRSSSLPPRKKENLYNIKERSASVKPRTRSRKVAVKRYNTRETITRRFVNYCYRLWCQFYCYLTCIILIIFTVICII